MKMKTTIMAITAAAALALAATSMARAQDTSQAASQAASQPAANMSPAEMDATIERARADYRADKVELITKNMNFSGQESATFWPIYHEYQGKLTQINDKKVALVRQYASAGDSLSDEQAKAMTEKWFELQGDTLNLEKDYYGKMADKLSPKLATRFFQLEHRINLVTDLQLASALPMTLQNPAGGGGGQ